MTTTGQRRSKHMTDESWNQDDLSLNDMISNELISNTAAVFVLLENRFEKWQKPLSKQKETRLKGRKFVSIQFYIMLIVLKI